MAPGLLSKSPPREESHDSSPEESSSEVSLTDEGQSQSSRGKPTGNSVSVDPQGPMSSTLVKRTRPASSSSDQPPAPGFGSMIERVHNVEHRSESPQKRVKMDHMRGQSTPNNFGSNGTPTPIGQFIRDQKAKVNGESARPPTSSDFIDLTADDENPGGQANDAPTAIQDVEVCLGKIDSSKVAAYQVPQAKHGGWLGANPNMWPPMMVSFRRLTGNNVKISVADGRGIPFGHLDPKTSDALATLLDNKLARLQPRLPSRRKKGNQKEADRISEFLDLHINVYAIRARVPGIGAHLKRHNILLKDPTLVDRTIQVENPHEPLKRDPAFAHRYGIVHQEKKPVSFAPVITRTAEEVKNDVAMMFDTMTKEDAYPESEQPDVVKTPLLAHQKQALSFLLRRETGKLEDGTPLADCTWKEERDVAGNPVWLNVVTNTQKRSKPKFMQGGILADLMGLGKTLSMLSLVVHPTVRKDGDVWSYKSPIQEQGTGVVVLHNAKTTLLICPTSTVSNWEDQLRAHIKRGALSWCIYHGPKREKDPKKLREYDIVITTYNLVSVEAVGRTASPLKQIGWFRIILDEAHTIRQQSTKQSQAVCSLTAARRWAVTGTPVQNRIDDLGALVKFLRIQPFDDKGSFAHYIISPLKNADTEILPRLRLLVDNITLRRSKDKLDLPKRTEENVTLDFSKEEQALYSHFEKDSRMRVKAVSRERQTLGGRTYAHILRAILRLRLICAHGSELLSDDDMKLTEGLDASNAIELDDDEDDEDKPGLAPKQAFDMLQLLKTSDMDRCAKCELKMEKPDEDDIEVQKDSIIGYMTPCYQIVCSGCFPSFMETIQETKVNNMVDCPLCSQNVRASFFPLQWDQIEQDEEARALARSNPKLAKTLGRYNGPHTKTKYLLQRLEEDREWSLAHPDEAPIKSVVFSGWTSHLDLIQIAFEEQNVKYTRLDGRMSRKNRAAATDALRDDPEVQVILVSIGAGGLGLNLTAASKAYIMEPQFNPAAEAQAVDRVHRLGQKRDVNIMHLIMENSFEEKMLDLQRKKRDLADLATNRYSKINKQDAQKRRLEELRSLFR